MNWILKNKVIFAILCFIIFIIMILLPNITNFVYHRFNEDTFFIVELNVSDYITYYSALIVFTGTILLGFLSLYQNHSFKIENEKNYENDKREKRFANRPIYSFTINREENSLFLLLNNITDFFGNNCRLIEYRLYDVSKSKEFKVFLKDFNVDYSFEISIINFDEYNDDEINILEIEISYDDIFGYRIFDSYSIFIYPNRNVNGFLIKREEK